jgi:large subunit ribosomal protein L21
MYAVVETGGRQCNAQPGKQIVVEKLPVAAGTIIAFERLLLVVDDAGQAHVGQPYVPGARAVATVVSQERAKKILVFKYKPKKNYRRRQGHRQSQSRLLIDRIELPALSS